MTTEELVKALVGTVEAKCADETTALLIANATNTIERQAEAIRVLREELRIGVAMHGIGTSKEWEASAQEALAQTKEFGE